MLDLLIHKDSEFIELGEITTDPKTMLAQSYIGLLLTELGSVPIKSDLGVNLRLGKSNAVVFPIKAQEINNSILEQLSTEYGLRSIDIESLEADGDYIKMKVRLVTDSDETILTVAV